MKNKKLLVIIIIVIIILGGIRILYLSKCRNIKGKTRHNRIYTRGRNYTESN